MNHHVSHHYGVRARAAQRRRSVASELGFTIIEILVSVAILGIIVVPIAMAFSVSFRVTEQTGASLTTSINRDQLGYRFTNDVASVDATGASLSATATCDTSPSGGGTLLITLNSTRQVTATATSSRVSYWVTGSGRDISIARRACPTATPGSAATNGKEIIVAQKLGTPGAVASSVVHGPFASSSPCNEYRCQLEIDGRSRFQVTAQRRVFGAGVPLEVGKIYSSSHTRDPSSGKLYEHYRVDGTSTSSEKDFTDQLTLPGGLDGPPLLTVRFAVQQKLNGNYLVCPGAPADYLTCTFSSAAESWVDGSYNSGTSVWRLPLRVGPADVLNAGGEYRISTELKPTGATAKKYGGTKGFPLWIDWKPADTVFVKSGGSGDKTGRDPFNAADKIVLGYQAASLVTGLNKPEIIVANGNYNESVGLFGASYSDNRTIVGAHDPTTWLRGNNSTSSTKLIGTEGYGLEINGKKLQRIRQMGVSSGLASVANPSVTGLYVNGGATVVLENSRVTSSPGLDGANGTTPAPRGTGCLGNAGAPKSRNPVNDRTKAPPRATTWNFVNKNPPDPPQPYNAPAENCKQGGNRDAGFGGNGGVGDVFGAKPGGKGGNGNGVPTGAPGGNGGGGGFCGSTTGGVGQAGRTSTGGNGGTTQSINTSWTGRNWIGMAGVDGAAGADGYGGGGAGGGGANTCFGVNSDGASGGSGGEGGARGNPGTAGAAGGASFGIVVTGAGSSAKVLFTTVTPSKGGKGGKGGIGGVGGYGGAGGRGAFNGLQGADSGGGGGGSGGAGGGGGSGGQAGASVGILWSDGGNVVITGQEPAPLPAFAPTDNGKGGVGGAGGAGGQGGAGANGQIDLFFFTLNYSTSPGFNGAKGEDGKIGADMTVAPPVCAKWTRNYTGQVAACV